MGEIRNMAKIKSIIGFEVDTKEIRATEISRNNGVYEILACGNIPLPEGTVDEGFIRDQEAFNIALTELIQSGGFRSSDIVVGINNENVIMRYATFPKVDDDKLRNMVLLQAQEFIPIPVQEMEIDYVVAGHGFNDEEQETVNVLLVAARRNMIEQYINILSASKFQVTDVDATLLSYCRALKTDVVGEEKYAVLNMNDDLLNFLVIQGDEISMARSINIPERVAENVKRLYNSEAGYELEKEDIEAVGSMLGSETSSSVGYYSMRPDIAPIEHIYFLTTAPHSQELLNEITGMVSLPVTIPDFYKSINFGLEQNVINKFTGCIGLAIQALEG